MHQMIDTVRFASTLPTPLGGTHALTGSPVVAARIRFVRQLPGWIALAVAILCPACGRDAKTSQPKAGPPAKVEKLPLETEISRLTLTPQAAERLGISVAAITREKIDRRRTFGGEVMIPGGKSIIVSAPVTGTIARPKRTRFPCRDSPFKSANPCFPWFPC